MGKDVLRLIFSAGRNVTMKNIISVLIICVLMFTIIPHLAMMQSCALDSELIVYPQYDERIPRCYDYGVTVHQGNQSEKLTVCKQIYQDAPLAGSVRILLCMLMKMTGAGE